MTRVVTFEEIARVLPSVDAVGEVERGFVALSEGRVDVPPVGELLFPDANGELHIKYGAIRGGDVAVVKVATGFYDNPAQGLPPFGGLNLVMSARTGMAQAVLLDEGSLTNVRTAAAGAVAARHLAPTRIEAIGILGSGPYPSLSLEGCILEAAQGLKARLDPLTIVSCDVDVREVADLADTGEGDLLAASLDDLACGWIVDRAVGQVPASWAIAKLLQADDAGILAPSFAPGVVAAHVNLVLWRWNND